MNKVMLLGRLARDPEIKQIREDLSVTQLTVVTSKKWKDKSGEMQEKAEFTKCSAWNKTGEIIEKYFSKGDPIYVEGELETNSYEKDGETRYATQVKVSAFEFVPAKPKNSESKLPEPENTGADFPEPKQSSDAPKLDDDEDLPF